MTKKANAIIGDAIRRLRTESGFTQQILADKAEISYQYLSSIENGNKNITIDVLQSLATALNLELDALIESAYSIDRPLPPVEDKYFIPGVVLPPGLNQSHVKTALTHTHKIMRLVNAALNKSTGRTLPSYIQGNNFSGIVSNILTDAFSVHSPYKHNHDQKYPDLLNKDSRGNTIAGLEVKSTIQKGKGGESHNGHSGWHVVACFKIDEHTGDIQFIHVMFADLIGHGNRNADWKYVGSKVNKATGSQRTETYNTTSRGAAKLRHGSLYLDSSAIDFSRWRIDRKIPTPAHSLFQPKPKKVGGKKKLKRPT